MILVIVGEKNGIEPPHARSREPCTKRLGTRARVDQDTGPAIPEQDRVALPDVQHGHRRPAPVAGPQAAKPTTHGEPEQRGPRPSSAGLGPDSPDKGQRGRAHDREQRARTYRQGPRPRAVRPGDSRCPRKGRTARRRRSERGRREGASAADASSPATPATRANATSGPTRMFARGDTSETTPNVRAMRGSVAACAARVSDSGPASGDSARGSAASLHRSNNLPNSTSPEHRTDRKLEPEIERGMRVESDHQRYGQPQSGRGIAPSARERSSERHDRHDERAHRRDLHAREHDVRADDSENRQSAPAVSETECAAGQRHERSHHDQVTARNCHEVRQTGRPEVRVRARACKAPSVADEYPGQQVSSSAGNRSDALDRPDPSGRTRPRGVRARPRRRTTRARSVATMPDRTSDRRRCADVADAKVPTTDATSPASGGAPFDGHWTRIFAPRHGGG